MRQIPAKCGYCGYLFPSGYGFDPGDTGVEASMKAWENAPVSTPCPMCGRRRGRVLAGEYEFVKDTMTLLSGPESTVQDLEWLTKFLEGLQGTDATADEIRERADHEAPEVSALVRKLLAVKPSNVPIHGWLTLLATIIVPLVVAYMSGEAEKPEPSQAIYNNYGDQYNITVKAPAPTDGDAVVKEKFKKCHGDPTREVPGP
jgi:rubredoxin